MTSRIVLSLAFIATIAAIVPADDGEDLRRGITFHASFDQGFDAEYSRGAKACLVKQGKEVVAAKSNDEVTIDATAGKYGGALHFTRKGTYRPQYGHAGVLNYNDQDWNASVSSWLRLDPDKDLEPGYCDPIQIVGDDSKKGFIFLEWSKDETPRLFRFAIRPLFSIWNPNNVTWADIPFDKRPMVQVERAPFSRAVWTHVVFSMEHINHPDKKPIGRLHLNGKLQGTIENWDLRFAWDPSQVWLVLGASYVGYIDDLAVFDHALTESEVLKLYQLPSGVQDLYR